MISEEKCKQILNKGKRKYTSKEVIEIKRILSQLINADIKNINTDEKSDYLHQSFDR